MSWIAIGIGGGLALTSTAMDIAGNAKEQSAINAARNSEAQAQTALQRQSSAIANTSIQGSTKPVADQQIATGAAQRNALFQSLQKASVPVASANPVTGAGSARTSAGGTAWENLVGGNQSAAGGYGDWENQQRIKDADANQKLGIVNSFSQGTASLLPIQLQVAGQAGDKLSGWGNIVGALGKGVSAYGVGSAMIGASTAGGAATAGQSAQALSEYGGASIPATTLPASNFDWSTVYG